MKDCIIVGGGPAGLTAGIYLARFLRDTALFDAGRPRAHRIPRTRNLPGYPDGIEGPELLDRMRRQLDHYDVEIRRDRVTSASRIDGGFRVEANGGALEARTLILATGVTNRPPQIPEEIHNEGVARGLIRYCPICDAYEVRGKKVAILGSGPHAVAEGRFVRHYAEDVTVVRPEHAPLDDDGERALSEAGLKILPSHRREIRLDGDEIVVEMQDGREARFDTLYVALGTDPHSDLARDLGADLTEAGCIPVDEHCETSIEGLFAIGDVIAGLDQIAYGMGHAAVATTAIHNRLLGR
ncbi:thioredoxin reductase (NADPH) [Limimaricola soesokkakensis]|uniref:Thioredoxin reductase n=1 Tax=Limimaricola soesokkakensis TaxID=1343159 RepID=A0A1X6YUP0_9RHOB|nr:NAD(P)/FAD-dependent oxidoreductase [Limimaricola soesokkakensis]PSK87575.1 thioredoxin reductase (NADPH) [Limimaricola soesokkakensis]SLN31404.1 Thioredoxin reductase [Limimaricola soesokkakensis]